METHNSIVSGSAISATDYFGIGSDSSSSNTIDRKHVTDSVRVWLSLFYETNKLPKLDYGNLKKIKF